MWWARVKGSGLKLRVRLGRGFTLVFVLSLVLGALQAAPAAASTLSVLRTGFAYREHSATYPSTPGSGPLGLAFGAGGALYALGANGQLYVTPAGGGTPAPVATVATQASGLTLGRNGKLYLTRPGPLPAVVEYDPAGGAIRDIVPGLIPGPQGIATDPNTGDLMVAASDGFVYRIGSPGSATPTAIQFREILAGIPLHAISLISDGTIFVSAGEQIFKASGIGRPTQVGSVVRQTNLGGFVVITRADAAGNPIPRFIYANRTDGVITKIDIIESGRRFDVLGGGTRGDYAILGPDGCLYATQSDAVVRVGGAAGTGLECDLAAAGEEAPFLVLSYTGTGARVGGAPQTVVARLTGRNVGGRVVTFTRNGLNPGVVTATTSAGGIATMSYTGTAVGSDVITATAQPELGPSVAAERPVSIDWRPTIDATGPVIRPIVTGKQGRGSFSCPDYTLETAPTTSCGYFVKPPSITWVITDPDGTAIDLTRTNSVNCPNYPAPFTLVGNSPPTGTPVACQAWNVDGSASVKTVILHAIVTEPTIAALRSPAPNTQGWNIADVTVSFQCGFPAGEHTRLTCTTPQTVTGQTLGSTVNGLAEDIAGNREDLAVLVKIDTTRPEITAMPSRPANANGWYTAPVTVSFTCSDSGAVASGLGSCSPPVLVGAEGTQTVTGTATDIAGNVETASLTIKVDLSGPRIEAVADRPAGPGGWYKAPVTVTFRCDPGASGAATTACSTPRTVSTDGAAQPVTGSATDEAGRSATATLPVSVDSTPPTISGAPATAANAAGWHRGDVTIVFTCTDALSGVAACPPSATVGAEGTNPPLTASVTDVAGNLADTAVPGVRIDRTPPATAPAFGGPQFGGVYHDQVSVTLSATDALSGVASITYSATGAQTIPPKTVAGASVRLVIGAPGTTTLTYFATDVAGNVEARRLITLTTSDPVAPAIVMTGGTVTYDGRPHPVTATATANGWSQPLDVTYGLGGTTPPTQTPPTQAGTYTATTSFAGDETHRPATAAVTLLIEKAAPLVAWTVPAPIIYGTPLSGTQLNATASGAGGGALAGTFAYTPAAVAVLGAGTRTLSVTFTPADTTNYTTATKTVTLLVEKAAPLVAWTDPATITYGTPLSATQLNATATGVGGALAGTFAYTPAAGAVLGVGTRTLRTRFTPVDTTNYKTETASVTLIVTKVQAVVTLTVPPAEVPFGTPYTVSARATGPGGLDAPVTDLTYTQGVVTTTIPPEASGTYGVTARYPGDGSYLGAPATGTFTIGPEAIAPTVTVPPTIQSWSASGATVSATLAAARGSVTGLTLIFTVDGRTFSALTGATGSATVTVPGLIPGTYTVTAAFAGLGIVQPSSGSGQLNWARELGVGALGCGDLHTSSLRFAGTNVKVNAQVKCDGTRIRGQIEVDPGKSGRKLTITKFTGFGRTADLRQAFVFGTTDDGRPVVVIVEVTDVAGVGDKFELRIANVSITGDGVVKKGDVRIKAGSRCDDDSTDSEGLIGLPFAPLNR